MTAETKPQACECLFHRYHVVHVYQGVVYDHSQGTWDEVLRDADPQEIRHYPSSEYRHGMTGDELVAASRASLKNRLEAIKGRQ